MTTLWTGFIILVLLLLWLDLGVFNREAHVVSTREALWWTAFWVVLALAFSGFVYYIYEHHWLGIGLTWAEPLTGIEAWHQYLTGYIVEKSLSLDNVFVIALIFEYFRVPRENQHRTLFYGILGALVFRAVMIVLGAALIHRFDWMITVFGVILLLTALRMLFTDAEHVEPDKNKLVVLARRLYPVTAHYEGQKFFTKLEDGRRAMTPLFLVLLVIESTDILFAVDSIPAIFGITRDPFLVFTSNVFAILGLRALFFVLAGMMARFHYLKPALVFVLIFIAVKMLIHDYLPEDLPTWIPLVVIFAILLTAVLASLLTSRPEPAEPAHPAPPSDDESALVDDDERAEPSLPGTAQPGTNRES